MSAVPIEDAYLQHEQDTLSPAMMFGDPEAIDPSTLGADDESDADDGAMTEDELISHLEQEESRAHDHYMSVAQERAEAIDYYFREPFGNEEDGRSQIVTSDVMDAIEGMLPGLLKPFVASDDVVKFTPVSEEDVKGAEQETDYLNNVFMQKNDGFSILYKWVKDGIWLKNGVVKYYWDTVKRVQIERYKGLTDDQMMLLMYSVQGGDIQITKHEAYPDPHAQQEQSMPAAQAMQGMQPPAQPQLHDVHIRIRDGKGVARVVNVPPEEFLISADAVDANPKRARFVEHRRQMSISDLRQMGYEVDDDIDDSHESLNGEPEKMSRMSSHMVSDDVGEGAARLVLVREMYPLIDFDGDGIAERRMICMVGRTMLCNEEVEEPPFSGWTPYPIPHRYDGVSTAEMVMPDQLVNSTLERQALDNIYSMNNNRTFVSGKVDLDDLLENPLGGIIRVRANDPVGNHVMAAPVSPIGQFILPHIEYRESKKEQRTGNTRYNQGLDAESLNKTATGVKQITQAGNERMELIARVFAETGLKDLMISLHGLVRRNASGEDKVRLRNQWVTVDPRNWVTRDTMTVNVGLGTGDKATHTQNLMWVVQAQKEALQGGLADAKKIFNTLSKIVVSMGYKDPHEFWNDPNDPQWKPPPPPKPPEVQVEETRLQGKQAELAAKTQESTTRLNMENDRETLQANREAMLEKYKTDQNVRQATLAALIKVAAEAVAPTPDTTGPDGQVIPGSPDKSGINWGQFLGDMMTMSDPGNSGDDPNALHAFMAQQAQQNQMMMSMMGQLAQGMNVLAQAHSTPKEIIRDGTGKAVGVRPVQVPHG